jgi:hypothetical protein
LFGEDIVKRAPIVVVDPTYTVAEFCEAERISNTRFFDYLNTDRAPRYWMHGSQIRITHQARLDWQRDREAETLAKLATPGEQERRQKSKERAAARGHARSQE